jgi:hypothetical protein
MAAEQIEFYCGAATCSANGIAISSKAVALPVARATVELLPLLIGA